MPVENVGTLTTKIGDSVKMSPDWYRNLAKELDWYVPQLEPVKVKVPRYSITVREKIMYINKGLDSIFEGFEMVAIATMKDGTLIIQGTRDEEYGIKLFRRKSGGGQINIPGHLRTWLANRSIMGKYEVTWNEDYKWVQTGEKISEEKKGK